jgi:peptide deformylase
MALLNILHFPDPRLRTVAKAVTNFDDELRLLVSNMFETMYEAPQPRSIGTSACWLWMSLKGVTSPGA